MKKGVILPIFLTFLISWLYFFVFYFYIPLDTLMTQIWLLIFSWVPGLIGLYYADKHKVGFSIKFGDFSYYMKVGLLVIGLSIIVLCMSIPFGNFQGFTEVKELFPNMINFTEKEPLSTISIVAYFFCFMLIFGLFVNMLYFLGQEIFWRGLIWEQIKSIGGLKASLLIGFGIGIWGLPLLLPGNALYDSHDYYMLGLQASLVLAFAIGISPLLCYFCVLGKGVMVSAGARGVLFIAAQLLIFFFHSPNQLLVGWGGAVGLFIIIGYSWSVGLYNSLVWNTILYNDTLVEEESCFANKDQIETS